MAYPGPDVVFGHFAYAYGGIISVLRSPAGDNYTQCVRVAQAVVSTRWGTTSYASLC